MVSTGFGTIIQTSYRFRDIQNIYLYKSCLRHSAVSNLVCRVPFDFGVGQNSIELCLQQKWNSTTAIVTGFTAADFWQSIARPILLGHKICIQGCNPSKLFCRVYCALSHVGIVPKHVTFVFLILKTRFKQIRHPLMVSD